VRPGGRIVISEPPDVDRWDDELVSGLGLRRIAQAPAPSTERRAARDLDGLVAIFRAG
jgi:hypothetical protein